LLKSCPTGVEWGHNRGNFFTCVYIGKYFKNLFQEPLARKAEILIHKHFLTLVQKQVCLNQGPWGLGGATIGETFHMFLIQKTYFKKIKNHWARQAEIYTKAFLTWYKIKFVKIMANRGQMGPQ
jgi:hypothetical protein